MLDIEKLTITIGELVSTEIEDVEQVEYIRK